MKHALVCPNEPVLDGYRIAQVEHKNNIFPVAEPLYWTYCEDEVVADSWYFDPVNNKIKQVPVPVVVAGNNQPTTTGSQAL